MKTPIEVREFLTAQVVDNPEMVRMVLKGEGIEMRLKRDGVEKTVDKLLKALIGKMEDEGKEPPPCMKEALKSGMKG